MSALLTILALVNTRADAGLYSVSDKVSCSIHKAVVAQGGLEAVYSVVNRINYSSMDEVYSALEESSCEVSK